MHVQRPRGRDSEETSGQWVQGVCEGVWGGMTGRGDSVPATVRAQPRTLSDAGSHG